MNKHVARTLRPVCFGTALSALMALVAASAPGAVAADNAGSSDWTRLSALASPGTTYSRSGPDERAARYAPVTLPTAGAALPTSTDYFADEFTPDSSKTTRETLQTWGPWLTRTGVSDNARQLLVFLANSESHGLSPDAYALDKLEIEVAEREHDATLAAFEVGIQLSSGAAGRLRSIDDDAKLERAGNRLARLLDSAFTRVLRHLGSGVVDARATQRGLFRDVPRVDTDALQAKLASGAMDVNGALLSVMPLHKDYRRLVKAMETLLDEREYGRARTHVPEVGSLWVGHHHDDVMYIKRRMLETGDLPLDTALTPMFDAPLKLAVESFQARRGIPPSGIVDKRTRDAMNIDVNGAITAVALSLERWRWMPRELGERHFFMNLPSYRLEMRNGQQRIIDMRVVIGATEHPTPTFSREMSYVEVNPTWSVPASIAHRELLPLELKKPGYLRSRNFDFLKYRDGRYRKVPYDSVTKADMRKRPFPYLIRQRGGDNNALGRMKFMMPNPYAIYLHDTQAKKLFKHDDRAYSHGCIRLGDPEHLLNVLLQIDGKSSGSIESLLARSDTRRVSLDTPVPTHLAYFTTWVDEHGALQQRADVYRHDAALEQALADAGTLLSHPEAPRNASRYGAFPVSALRG